MNQYLITYYSKEAEGTVLVGIYPTLEIAEWVVFTLKKESQYRIDYNLISLKQFLKIQKIDKVNYSEDSKGEENV